MHLKNLKRALRHRQQAAEAAAKDPKREPIVKQNFAVRAECYAEILELIET